MITREQVQKNRYALAASILEWFENQMAKPENQKQLITGRLYLSKYPENTWDFRDIVTAEFQKAGWKIEFIFDQRDGNYVVIS